MVISEGMLAPQALIALSPCGEPYPELISQTWGSTLKPAVMLGFMTTHALQAYAKP